MTLEQFDQILENVLFVGSMIFVILLVDSIFFLCYYFGVKKKLKYWEKISKVARDAEGTIVGIQEKKVGSGTDSSYSYYAHYVFRDMNGREYAGQFVMRKHNQFTSGDRVTVHYDPSKPSDNYTDYKIAGLKGSEKFLVGMMIGIPCILMAALIVGTVM